MDKIKLLIKSWPKGTVRLSSSLKTSGYSKDLLNKYVNSEWLESLGYSAYKISGDKIEWYGAVNALQNQKNSMLHPGGKTALELKGYAHYLSFRKKRVIIFLNHKENIPQWLKNQDWEYDIIYKQIKLFDYNSIDSFSNVEINNIKIKISSPELAAMEMLYMLPKEQTFDESEKIFEALTTLRPQIVQSLLEQCISVKVKRLFLYMADKNNHQWFKELDINKIDLGSGKRQIVKNGSFNKRYNITVPKGYER